MLETKLDDLEAKNLAVDTQIASNIVAINDYEKQVSELSREIVKKDDVIGNLKLQLG